MSQEETFSFDKTSTNDTIYVTFIISLKCLHDDHNAHPTSTITMWVSQKGHGTTNYRAYSKAGSLDKKSPIIRLASFPINNLNGYAHKLSVIND